LKALTRDTAPVFVVAADGAFSVAADDDVAVRCYS
jgi:hypothetical protein